MTKGTEQRPRPNIESGLALITALLILSFLTILGSALLSSTTVDVRIADNYRTNTQLLFLAEAGIEAGREQLRTSANALSADLVTAAGADGNLSTSVDLDTLVAADDIPLIPTDAGLIGTGETLSDASGATVGTYHVFMRNDPVDGETSTTETNDVVTLVATGTIGTASKTIEVVVKRGSFPPVPAALTLNGGIGPFDAANSNLFNIDGDDQAGSGNNENAVGVIAAADDTTVSDAIPANRQDNYTGDGGEEPDVADVSGELAGLLTTTTGLESIVASVSASATTSYYPAWNGVTSISTDIGAANDYQVTVVHGDLEFGPADGYGILLVRGSLTVSGNFSWTGLILLIGQGELHWNGGGNGVVTGGIFLATTRGTPYNGNAVGDQLADRGDVIADFNGGGGNGILYDTTAISDANASFPYALIAVREFD